MIDRFLAAFTIAITVGVGLYLVGYENGKHDQEAVCTTKASLR